MGGNTTTLQIGHNSSKLGVTLYLPFIHRVVGVKEEGVRKGKGGNGGGNSNSEGVNIGNKDDSTLIGDGVLSLLQTIGNSGEGSPLLQVEHGVGIGEVIVSLVVSTGAHDNPAEHGVTSVPDFGLGGGSPSPCGELGVFLFPALCGIVEDRTGNGGGGPETTKLIGYRRRSEKAPTKLQIPSNTSQIGSPGDLGNRGGRSERRNGVSGEGKSSEVTKLDHFEQN